MYTFGTLHPQQLSVPRSEFTTTGLQNKALQLCVELRVFLSEVPFLRESVVIYSYILVHQI